MMNDELKDKVLNSALNACIRKPVITKQFQGNYIIRVELKGVKDFVYTYTLQEFRKNRTHVIVDNVLKSFRQYIVDSYIDYPNWELVFKYLCNKEYQAQEE